MSRVVFITLLTMAALAPAQMASRALGETAPKGSLHIDKEREGDLLGNGQAYIVRWCHRGPLPPGCAACPPDWVRGVEVRSPAKTGVGKSEIIASWAPSRTAIRAFYPELNRLWPISGGGELILAAVQYGGRLIYAYMFRLEGNALREVWHWGGMSASVTTINGRLVLEAQSQDYFQVPRLYAWTGKDFGDVSRDFPSFYAELGASYAKPIQEPVLSGVLAENCQLALQAYVLARRPELGRKACLARRERIVAGRGVTDASWRNYPAMRRQALAEIDSLLSEQSRHF